jgi:hypothetical protein
MPDASPKEDSMLTRPISQTVLHNVSLASAGPDDPQWREY